MFHLKYTAFLWAVVFIFISTPASHAQTQTEDSGLLKRCGGYFGLCGYISEPEWKTNRREVEVLPKVYEALGDYNEGLAPVRVKGRWGFMDRTGVMKIDPAYTSVSPFDHGLAVVGTQTGYGLIDKTGKQRLEPKFKWLVIYNQDRVFASQTDEIKFDPFARVHRYNRVFEYDAAPAVGLYDINSGWVTAQDLKFKHFDAESNSHIWAREDVKNSQYGLLNSVTGKWHIEPIYDEVREIFEGLAVVGAFLPGQSRIGNNKRLGAVNEQGQLVIPLKFDHLNDFWHGFGETREDGKIALVKKSGNLVGDKYFEDGAYARHDRSQRMVKDVEGRWWKVWPNGTLHPEEGFTFLTCPSGLSFEGFMERTVITHPDGRILGDDFQSPQPKLSNYFTDEQDQRCNGPISVNSAADKWGFISPDGESLADGIVYDNLTFFKEVRDGKKIAGFETNGLWGIMDETGDILREPLFKSESGALESTPGYETEIGGLRLVSGEVCAGGSRLFLSNQKWGLQDEGGRVLLEAKHDLLTCFRGGTALVPDYKVKKWCHVDYEGNRRPDLPCQNSYYPYWASHTSPEVLDPDPWLNSVKWTRQYYEYGLGLRGEEPKLIPW